MSSTLTVYVKDSIMREPVAVAEVSVSIGDQRIGAGHTDRKEGSFTKSIDPQYVGQTLTCWISKDGYEPQGVTRDVHEKGVEIEVALTPETVWPKVKGNVMRAILHFMVWSALFFLGGYVTYLVAVYIFGMSKSASSYIGYFVWIIGTILSLVLAVIVWRQESNKLIAIVDKLIVYMQDKARKHLKRRTKRHGH